MGKRLAPVVIIIEVASVAALLFLLTQPGLPPRFAVMLVFALPIFFGLHVTEEFIFPGGAADTFRQARPKVAEAYTEDYLYRVNVIPLALAFLVTLGTFDFAGGFSFFGIRAWLAFVSFQAIHVISYHVADMFRIRRYSPGIVTGIVLYFPLAVVAFVYLLGTGVVDVISAVVAVGVGFAVVGGLERIKATTPHAAVQ